ncbi:MAG: hypothetical protein Q7U41_01840 [Microbacterium sp.]|nr:hypothetical protein [Microbacterium sp.]
MHTARTAIGALLAAIGALLIGVAVALPAPAQALSYDPDRWQAGYIISDANFYDGSAMSREEVRDFLESKAASGCAAVKGTSSPCLVDAKDQIRSRAATAACRSIDGRDGAPADEIIVTVARACGISPKVILATLQKEQGLVTSSDPSQWSYDHAMGWGCPDSAACETTYNGLFNQVYMGAAQFQNYRIYPSSFTFRANQTIGILSSPAAGCPYITVTIQNWATAALYNYTPYTPNKAALENYPGTASCGSYGNRNFWAAYNDWFGSSIAGGSIIKKTSGSDRFLIVGDSRWRIKSDDKAVKKGFAPLGPTASVSGKYVESFDEAATLTNLARDADKTKWLVDQGRRYKLPNCPNVELLGFTGCSTAPTLTDGQLRALEKQGRLGAVIETGGDSRYVLADGERHEFTDRQALEAAGYATEGKSELLPATITRIPLGRPVIPDGTVVRATGDEDRYYAYDGSLWRVPEATWTSTSMQEWLGEADEYRFRSGSLSLLGVRPFPAVFVDESKGRGWMLAEDGRVRLDLSGWPASPDALPSELVNRIPDTGRSLGSRFFQKTDAGGFVLIDHGVVRSVRDKADKAALAAEFGIAPRAQFRPAQTLSELGSGPRAIAPGRLVHLADGSRVSVTGYDTAVTTSGLEAKQMFGTKQGEQLGDAAAAALTVADGGLGLGASCESQRLVLLDGVAYAVTSEDSSHWRPVLGFAARGAGFCVLLDPESRTIGTAVKNDEGARFRIKNGEARRLSDDAYTRLKPKIGKARPISDRLLSEFPKGERID